MRRVTCVQWLLASALIALCLPPITAVRAAGSFATPAFQQQWQQGEAITPNFWGPLANAHDSQQEPYKETPGGQRLVQYFDKGRMELTNGVVTNGLLAADLIKGQIQLGDATFQNQPSPAIPIAGDLDNPGPTYAGLSSRAASLFAPTPAKPGTIVTLIAAADSTITDGGGYAGISMSPAISTYDSTTQHNILGVFADYRNRVGLPTIGLAISEPFRTNVKVAGAPTTVLVQVFERRVLTYTASNADAFKVEMGNIGQHYYRWRYVNGVPAVTTQPVTSGTSTGYPGKIVYQAAPASGDQVNPPIYVMNPDTTGRTVIGNGSSPVFSPDGTRIAFYVELPVTSQDTIYPKTVIRSVKPDGSDVRDIFNTGGGAHTDLVRWSPSGRFIAVNRTQNGPGGITFVDVSAGTQTSEGAVMYLQGLLTRVYDWTADGSNALWQASTPYWQKDNLFYGDPDRNGTGAVQLTTGQYLDTSTDYSYRSFYKCARFSPDGKTIAVAGTKLFFLSTPGQHSQLEGKTIEGITNVDWLAWSPNGRALAVLTGDTTSTGDMTHNGQLSIVDVASGKVTLLGIASGSMDWSRQ